MLKPITRFRRSLLTAVAVGLLLAACGNSDDKASSSSSSSGATTASSADVDTTQSVALSGVPGVTDTEIRYAALGTNSNNPLGTCVLDCFSDGIQAYFDFRNSQGGIYGRKLVLSKKVDDELGNNQAKALEIISANDTFGTFSAAQIGSGWADLAAAGIPVYTWMINPAQMTGHPEIFGNVGVACIECTSRAVANAAKIAGAKKVASLGYGISENSKQCANANAKTIEQYGANVGGPTVGYVNDHLDFGLPNGIGPEVTEMKNAGVDLVYVCLDLNGAKTLAQEMQRQGIRDKVKLYHANTYDQQFVKDAAPLFVGDYVNVGFRPFESDPAESGLKDFQEWMGKSGKQITEIAMDGWINADLAYEGLIKATPTFDRAKVIAGTNTLTEFTADGLTPPVDWSRQHEAPTPQDPATHGSKFDCQSLVQVQADSTFVMVGDKTKPFTCWPGQTNEWSEPTPMDFQ